MNQSAEINELATALALAQGELENASKSTKNEFFKSKYADLAEVLNTIRPVFSKNGLSVTQFPSYDAGIVSVETMLMHKSGQWLSGMISAPVSKQDAQGVGSATTYCRRYSLAAVAGLAQEDDDANSAVGHKPPQKVEPQKTEEKKPLTAVERAKIELDFANCQNLPTLKKIWESIPAHEQHNYLALKEKRKLDLTAGELPL